MAGANTGNTDVDEVVDGLLAEYESLVVDLTIEMLANLREDTPRDTTHAAANWIASATNPILREDGEVKVAKRANKAQGLTKGQRYTTAGAADDSLILNYTLDDGDAWIANNVRYMIGPGSLNDGHSSQAAAGFIEAACVKAIVDIGTARGYVFDTNVFIVDDPPPPHIQRTRAANDGEE